ncbi:1530_t:CDS:2 [Funneliformis caledonium]|uniref:1530_t:CDS:1 n=1 Tax=Funneliformis caledonium TaxID=1117310 RepID=A0A9N9GVQ4_9GLOM|nr:1530_t:CDS:2 [Funneliformis caledonium]
MITLQLKTNISSKASYLSPADYKDIMQYRDMKSKPLAQLTVISSMNIMDKQNEKRILKKSCQTERPKEEF